MAPYIYVCSNLKIGKHPAKQDILKVLGVEGCENRHVGSDRARTLASLLTSPPRLESWIDWSDARQLRIWFPLTVSHPFLCQGTDESDNISRDNLIKPLNSEDAELILANETSMSHCCPWTSEAGGIYWTDLVPEIVNLGREGQGLVSM
jgi:hypothetical protein